MQRWFFLEDPQNSEVREGKGDAASSIESSLSFQYSPRHWLFRVRCPKLKEDETVCVVGDLKELGTWRPENCVPLQQEEEDSNIWSGIIEIPDNRSIQYRYCICVVIEKGIQVIVRNWETNLKAREIGYSQKSPSLENNVEVYGYYNNSDHCNRGWLSKETVVTLKLCNNPLTLWKPKYKHRQVFIKVTPVSLGHNSSNMPLSMSEALDESLSDTQDGVESVKFSFTELAVLNADDPSFRSQDQFGTELKKDDMMIFQSTVVFPQNTAYLFDFYIFSSRSEEGEPPYHAGFSYLLPTALQSSEGYTILPVTSIKHRALGELRVDYLVIGAMPNYSCDMNISYARHWKKTRSGLDVGHRGSGSSFKAKVQNCAEVRENTIASLKNAIEHGADFVEFDVQLSKDLVPIIYHDFHVCISMKKKRDIADQDMLEIPLKELTLEQLQLLKVRSS